MSDTYEALLDSSAGPDQAAAQASVVVQVLSAAGLIVPKASADCVLDGVGYPAGPRCGEVYRAQENGDFSGNDFWTLRTSGVQVLAERWVNIWGFTQFSGAACPRCNRNRGDDFLDEVGSLVDPFMTSGVVPRVTCPACQSMSSVHDWKCDPHLGFANFAIVFWNWASFDDSNWGISVPSLLQDQLKRPLISTFGRM